MISSGITITSVADAEFTRLMLSTDSIVVDPYNVQADPLVIKVEHIVGADVTTASAYISLQAMSIGKPISGAVKDFGLCSKIEFTIPAKDKLYATATAIKVDAYSDQGKKKLIESKTVNVVCNQIPDPFYRGNKWASTMSFRNGDFLDREVDGNKSIYQWCSRVEGNTSKAPWDITLTTDPEYGYWEHVTERTLFAAKVLLVKNALIGSAVFNGDYMLSQHGTALKEGATYQNFTPDMKEFVPNIVLNYLTGYAHFAKKNVIFKENGDVEIKGYIREGRIGSFKLDKGITNITGQTPEGDYAYNPDAFIKLVCEKVSNDTRFSVNEIGTVGVCDINIGEKSSGGTGLRIFSFGQTSKCIHVTSNGGGVKSRAIDSHGNVDLHARTGEVIELRADKGGRVSAKNFYTNGLHLAIQMCTDNAEISPDVDFIRTYADGRHTITLPNPKDCPGKLYYYKNTNGTWDLKNGPFVWGNGWQQHTTITISDTQALQLISDGGQWFVFNCW